MNDFDEMMKKKKKDLVKFIFDRHVTIEAATKIEFAEGFVTPSKISGWLAHTSDGATIKTIFPTIDEAYAALINL